ncbi:MAG: ATP-binding protein [Planctomycetota bacterium]
MDLPSTNFAHAASAKADSLESLRSKGIDPFWLAPDELFGSLVETVEKQTSSSAVVVPPFDDREEVTVVSMATLSREMTRPFVRDLYWRRPVSEALVELAIPTLVLTADQTITAAAEAAISRDERSRYDPIVVLGNRDEDDYFLLDVHVLLRGQSDLLRVVRNELIETSRIAGQAEVASGVIHNVGNVLNSMNVAASTALDTLATGSNDRDGPDISTDLRRLVELLQQVEADDAWADFVAPDGRGRHVGAYLEACLEKLDSERNSVVQELTQIDSGIAHIRQIVQSQQSFVDRQDGARGLMDQVEASDLITRTLALHTRGGEDAGGIETDIESDLPSFHTDGGRVIQILGNFVSNATWAVSEVEPQKRSIRIGASRSNLNEVTLFVQDNGRGFPQREAGTLFRHGFTTRSSGHGFGLHSCALTADELGGSIRAMSGGIGAGARFELRLPIDPNQSTTKTYRVAA